MLTKLDIVWPGQIGLGQAYLLLDIALANTFLPKSPIAQSCNKRGYQLLQALAMAIAISISISVAIRSTLTSLSCEMTHMRLEKCVHIRFFIKTRFLSKTGFSTFFLPFGSRHNL